MACIHGNDCLQRPHHDAQKTGYTTRPRNGARRGGAAAHAGVRSAKQTAKNMHLAIAPISAWYLDICAKTHLEDGLCIAKCRGVKRLDNIQGLPAPLRAAGARAWLLPNDN